MGMKVQAVRIHRTGGPEVLTLDTLELEPPGAGQVRVRHQAIGVNFIDVYQRNGLYALSEMPATIGSEACGLVEAVGPSVEGWAVGDRVAYAGLTGAYCEARNVPASRLVRVPASLDAGVVAASLLKGMTVEYLIHRTFEVRAGQTVLFHAAAGGVGLLACQWLRHLGADVIGTVGTDDKATLARERGCTHVIVYRREDFVARVREITGGRGVPVAYDSVGKDTLRGSLDCLSPRGLLVSYGNASGRPDPLDILLLSQKGSLYVTRPTLHAYVESRADLELSASRLFEVLERGVVVPSIHATLPLSAAAEAHRLLESRTTTGSLVLRP